MTNALLILAGLTIADGARLDAQARPEILIVGTFHMSNPGRDGVDGDFPYYRLLNYAKANDLKEKFDTLEAATGRRVQAQSEYLRAHTVLEALEVVNPDSSVATNVASYFAYVPYGEPWEYAGPDLLAAWYQRNIRIYHNIRALATSPDDRILVIHGSGHLGWLQQDAGNDANVRLRTFAQFTSPPDSAHAHTPPPIVEIYRELPRPRSSLARYRALEDSAALLCRERRCPHPYLGLESTSGRKEVWYLNFFESQADMDRVTNLYAAVPKLNETLARFVAEKASLVDASNVFVRLRKDSTTRWQLAGARFLVATSPAARSVGEAASYLDSSDASFTLAFARTHAAADDLARKLGRNARVFEIKPAWSLPDPSWNLSVKP